MITNTRKVASRARAVLGLLLGLTLLGCSPEAEAPPPGTAGFKIEVGTGPGGGTWVTMDGVRMLVGSDVRLVYPSVTHTMSIRSPEVEYVATSAEIEEIQVNGNALSVRDGVLRLGGTGYGAVTGESTVRIRADGVHVDGEARGALPE